MRVLLPLMVLLAGCIPAASIEASLRTTSGRRTECPADQVTISNQNTGSVFSPVWTWTATGCGREWTCRSWLENAGTAYSTSRDECTETPTSNAATLRQVVLDRLALETSCPKEQVAVTREADWSRGGERAYRMTACGKHYVCTTAAGRTDCKPALAE